MHSESGESLWEAPLEGFVPYQEHGFDGEWWDEYEYGGDENGYVLYAPR